jgi:regulatory protein
MEKELIEEIISKENNNNYTVKKFKLNLSNKLIRNGFSNNIVYNLVEKLEVEDNSLELIEKDYNKLLLKISKKDKTDYEKKQLIINGLMQKGYEYQVISKYLKDME